MYSAVRLSEQALNNKKFSGHNPNRLSAASAINVSTRNKTVVRFSVLRLIFTFILRLIRLIF